MTQRNKRATKPGHKRGEFVEPIAAMQLYDEIGVTEAAKAIGTAATTLHHARRDGMIKKPYEIAARGLLAEMKLADIAVKTPTRPAGDVEVHHPAIVQARPAPVVTKAKVTDRVVLVVELPASKESLLKQVVEKFGGEIAE